MIIYLLGVVVFMVLGAWGIKYGLLDLDLFEKFELSLMLVIGGIGWCLALPMLILYVAGLYLLRDVDCDN